MGLWGGFGFSAMLRDACAASALSTRRSGRARTAAVCECLVVPGVWRPNSRLLCLVAIAHVYRQRMRKRCVMCVRAALVLLRF